MTFMRKSLSARVSLLLLLLIISGGGGGGGGNLSRLSLSRRRQRSLVLFQENRIPFALRAGSTSSPAPRLVVADRARAHQANRGNNKTTRGRSIKRMRPTCARHSRGEGIRWRQHRVSSRRTHDFCVVFTRRVNIAAASVTLACWPFRPPAECLRAGF